MRGLAALLEMLDRIGKCDDHAVAKILVENELNLRALASAAADPREGILKGITNVTTSDDIFHADPLAFGRSGAVSTPRAVPTGKLATFVAPLVLAVTLPLSAAAAPVTLPLSAAAAPVTWDFVVTSCNAPALPDGCDPAQEYPVTLATLTLDGPGSSGSAVLDAFSGASTLTGDPFYFALVPNSREFASTLYPLGVGWANGASPPGPDGLVDYALAWSEVGETLTQVRVSFLTEQDQVEALGLTSGFAGSDGELVGCANALCQVSGRWVVASEPNVTLAWLVSLVGFAAVGARKRNGRWSWTRRV